VNFNARFKQFSVGYQCCLFACVQNTKPHENPKWFSGGAVPALI